MKAFTNSVWTASVMNSLVPSAKQITKAVKILVSDLYFSFPLTYYLQKSCYNAKSRHF